MQELYIDAVEELRDLCLELRACPWLCIDTEFMREETYFPSLCLIQVATPELAACIDPLKLPNLDSLRKLLFDSSITKVFHGSRQDLEIFYHLWGKIPRPVFDTQLAAVLAGLGFQPSYAATVKSLLNVDIDKGLTRTNWSHRPLGSAQIRYALNDVIYLGQVYQKLLSLLSQSGRSEWLKEDFEKIVDPNTLIADSDKQWQRIQGSKKLQGYQLAVLKRLAAWRERQAAVKNRPRKWIMKDEVLLSLAKRKPCKLSELKQIPRISTALINSYGESILEEIKTTKPDSLDVKQPATATHPKPTLLQQAVVDLLMSAVKTRANAENITPNALATRKDIEQLILGNKNVSILYGWRAELIGKLLLEILDGQTYALVKDGCVEFNHLNKQANAAEPKPIVYPVKKPNQLMRHE